MANKVCPFLFFSICMFLVAQSLPTYQNLHKRGTPRLCGRMLVQALALVCQSQYYDPGMKRSYDDDVLDSDDSFWSKGGNSINSDYFLESKRSALPSAETYERIQRGVSDECCRKSCSINELLAYCH